MTDIFGYRNVQLVVLDKDGTLTDAHLFWSEIIRRRSAAIAEYYSLSDDNAVQLCRVMGLDTDSGRLLPEGPIAIVSRNRVIEIVTEFIESDYHIDTDEQTVSRLFDEVHRGFVPCMTDYVRLLPGVSEFLDRIYGHCTIVLITSDGRSSTEQALAHTGIIRYFDRIITRDECQSPKVTGEPLKRLLNDIGVSADSTAVIGDAEMDLRMAAAAGVRQVVLVATGQVSEERLSVYRQMYKADNAAVRIVKSLSH